MSYPINTKYRVRMPEEYCDMVYIAPGKFLMGTPSNEVGGFDNEAVEPQHEVTISRGFYISKYLCTAELWRNIFADNPTLGKGKFWAENDLTSASHFGYTYDTYPNYYPIVGMSIEAITDTNGFIDFLNAREKAAGRLPSGYLYTLPTEAEWEYCCRAQSHGSIYTGISYTGERPSGVSLGHIESSSALSSVAWYQSNAEQTEGEEKRPSKVGQKAPNDWGLYDFLGNVNEWTRDYCTTQSVTGYIGGKNSYSVALNNVYTTASAVDPYCKRSATYISYSVVRGGSYKSDPIECRCATRTPVLANSSSLDSGSVIREYENVGFRLALKWYGID